MAEPVIANIPHQLGREEARRRMEKGIGEFGDIIPGGVVSNENWQEDCLSVTIEALGQRLACQFDVQDTAVVATFDLPLILAPFADAIRRKLGEYGPKLLS
jgi:hypothetical protein